MICPSCGDLGIAAGNPDKVQHKYWRCDNEDCNVQTFQDAAAVKAAKAEVVANDFQANRMPVRAIDRMPAPVIPDTEAIYAD